MKGGIYLIGRCKNEAGLTLLEVLASLIILSIALMIMSNLLVHSFEVSGKEDSKLVAMNLARQLAESWPQENKATLLTIAEGLGTTGIKEMDLPATEINERTYYQKISFTYLDTSAADWNHTSMLLLQVEVSDQDRHLLAYLQSAIASPLSGEDQP